MKLTIEVNENIYEVYYNLKDENKPAPLERLFRLNFSKAVSDLQGNLEAIKIAINSMAMNINIYDIRVNE
jgi:hypothetical protein